MNSANDGGPAFPTVVGSGPSGRMQTGPYSEHVPGLSMRDWFAGHALAYMATVATHENAEVGGVLPIWSKEIAESLASDAYQIADAMLAARKGSAS